ANLGIYASGQAFEALLLRMRAHPLPEARSYAELMLTELRKVIPSWVRRIDVPDRGGAWSEYLEKNHHVMADLADAMFGTDRTGGEAAEGGDPQVTLVDWDPDAEVKTVAAMLYPNTDLPESQIQDRVARLSGEERMDSVRKYAGDRTNRRHRPGRALERCGYRFDVVSDYGAFRDLQRHRMLTIEWQDLTPQHGYTLPAAVVAAGATEAYHEAMVRSARLHGELTDRFGASRGAYAVALAYRVRYAMQFNAREAMHVLELRTTAQGHPEYRKVCQEMHRLIGEHAGHHAIAGLMHFTDHGSYEGDLERLAGERRAEERRSQARSTLESEPHM
ncbi:MAG: FAD-dependent thymidylate synthase, partial [Actinomycetes bacterium]